MRVFLFICVFLFVRPPCAVFPALFVCRNMADWNVDDPSFWFNDVLAARDEDEAIVDECYEAATDASDYAGSSSEGDRGMHQGKNEKFLVCQQGPIGDEIGTLGVRAWVRVLILD